MERFLAPVVGINIVKKYAEILEKNGAGSVEDLRYVNEEHYEKMGFLLIHRVKLVQLVAHMFKASTPPPEIPVIERKDDPSEKLGFSEKSEKNLQKLEEGLSTIFSSERLSELATFVRSNNDKGITLAAMKMVKKQLGFIKQLRKESADPVNHCFLSHIQMHSADLCHLLYVELTKLGINVWYDMKAGRLEARGMLQGIASAQFFIIIATKDYFTRQWPVFEAIAADLMRKPIVVLIESDTRHGGVSFKTFCELLPKPWKKLEEYEFMKVGRRGSFWEATTSEIKNTLLNKSVRRVEPSGREKGSEEVSGIADFELPEEFEWDEFYSSIAIPNYIYNFKSKVNVVGADCKPVNGCYAAAGFLWALPKYKNIMVQ